MNRLATLLLPTILLVLALALPALRPGPAQAQPAISLRAEPAYGGNYVPGAWLPLRVTVANGGEALRGTLVASLPDSSARHSLAVELAGASEQEFALYVDMSQATRELRVSLERDGAALAETSAAVRPRVDERLLAVVAGQDPQLALPRREDLARLPFTVIDLAVDGLPEQAAGLGSLNLLLLHDLPGAALSPAQIAALRAWVFAGGHLVLGGGPLAGPLLDGLPADMRAADGAGPVAIADDALAELAGAGGPGQLDGLLLAPLPGGIPRGPAASPAWVARPLGRGLITQLAFDPGAPALRVWPGAPEFWDRLLQPALLAPSPLGQQSNIDQLQEQIIGGALSALPTFRLPPANLIFAILAIYAVLVGPGLALILRRFDRQAWAWVAVPATALACTGLLFALNSSLRADQRVINQIDLVEAQGAEQARARSFIAVLAPQDGSIAAEQAPLALVRPVRSTSGLYGSVSGVAGDLSQAQAGQRFSVEAWRMQGLVADQIVALPQFTATIRLDDRGAEAELRNNSDQRLLDAVAVFGERVVRLGNLNPGDVVSRRWPPDPPDVPAGTATSYLILQEVIDAAREPGQAPARSDQIREALINAAVARDGSTGEAGPLFLAWMERSPLELTVAADGAAYQRQTLLAIRPTIGGSGTINLPQGWLRPDLAAAGLGPCFGPGGAGWPARSDQVELTLRLPGQLTELRAEALTISLDSVERWPEAGVTTEIYNWERATWEPRSFDGPGDLEIPQAAAYLRDLTVRVRLSGRISEAGCIYAGASLRGTLP